MKKSITILFMLIFGTATVFTSCKKDEEKSEKERVTELLVNGKWYYQSFDTSTCFNSYAYWEFKSNGSATDTYAFDADMTFTVSEDGKNITVVNGNTTYSLVINSITATAFTYTADFGDGNANVVLGKTALNCNPK